MKSARISFLLALFFLVGCAGLRAEQQLPPRYVAGSTVKALGIPILEATEWAAGDIGRAVVVPGGYGGYGYGGYGGITITMPHFDPCFARDPRSCPPGSVWQRGR